MCGISGYINIDQKSLGNTDVIIRMLMEQRHRGPDDSGIVAFNLLAGSSAELPVGDTSTVSNEFNGVLGFNRLSILDLSVNGHQPMFSPDKKVMLTLNGEIYNAFDYKNELVDSGYRFKSTSDTEVVLALFLKHGIDGLLSRINGMFAIVIVDLSEKRIIISRDRFGIKPMYYIVNKDYFAFSSELKSFRHLPGFSFELDHEQIDEYLLFRNNLDGTLYRNIRSLEPGHRLSYEPDKGFSLYKYFDINDYLRSRDNSVDIKFYEKNIIEGLEKSVRSQLMSDVKLGCQLSGGIDSSLVTLLANKDSEKGNFETVSIVFNDRRYNEEKYIDFVVNQLGIVSHKFLLDPDYYLENIEKATWHLEAPLNHPNTVAIYRLSQCAKEYVTVLLSGEGADEVFGGYERFHELCYPFRTKQLLHEIKKNITKPGNLIDYFDHELRAVMATSFMKPDLAKKIKNSFDCKKAIENRKSLYHSLKGSLLDRQIKYEIKSYLPDLLIRQDKMSMAHSIENRVPFLDNEIVRESFCIPEKLLIPNMLSKKNTEGKFLLKTISADNFGDDFAFRDKMGFGIPVKEFFSNHNFTEYMNDCVLPHIKHRNLFNHKLVSSWISGIKSLNNSEIEALWLIVSFEIWASLYLNS